LARKKIVFVIVEGPSEEDALGAVLNRVFDTNLVHLAVCHCDLTSKRGTTADNICSRVCQVVKDYAKENRFKSEDFQQIIHLIDTDGTYITPDRITLKPEAEDPIYTATTIEAKNPAGIAYRNQMKGEAMDRLATTSSMWNIPYRAYYMSCNLDHVLYDRLNTTDEEKEADALTFARFFKNDPDGFVSYICDSDFSVMTDYRESWKFIRDHSLERYTNFGLALPRNPATNTNP
jgi:hypothetical protein